MLHQSWKESDQHDPGVSNERLADAFAALRAPCTVALGTSDSGGGVGEDHIFAVNLTRTIDPVDPDAVAAAQRAAGEVMPVSSNYLSTTHDNWG